MRWSDFEKSEPRLAELGRVRLCEPGVVLVGTIRRDGSPRLSPVEPLLWNGELWLSMGWRTRKAADLQLDPRLLVHSIVTGRDGTAGEYKVRGRAVAEDDPAVHRAYAETVQSQLGWQPEPGRFHLFRVDVDDVTFIRWDSATNDQYVSRWPSRVEFVRRGTSATSLGDPELIEELLVRRDIE
jgi:Pyridoxamine 5'-phosphate oxidase